MNQHLLSVDLSLGEHLVHIDQEEDDLMNQVRVVQHPSATMQLYINQVKAFFNCMRIDAALRHQIMISYISGNLVKAVYFTDKHLSVLEELKVYEKRCLTLRDEL